MTARSLLLGEPNLLRRRRPSVSVAPIRSVTFPVTRLVTRVQVALGADLSADPLTWQWLDITQWVRQNLGISLSVGRRDEASQVTTGSATLKLDNRDGRFTRRNPNSPYYGLLSKNTPIWVTVDAGSGEKTRLEMFVNEWPTRWSDKSASDSTVTIRCAGILRRLGQGQVLKSALRRAYLSTDLLEYWPLEDNGPTLQAVSVLGGSPIISTVDLDFVSGQPGTLRALDMVNTTSHLPRGTVHLPTVDGFQIEWTALSDLGIDTLILHVAPFVDLTGVNFQVSAARADGDPRHYAARFTQNGGNVDVAFYVDGVLSSTTPLANTLTSEVAVYPRIGVSSTGSVTLAHIAVYSFAKESAPGLRSSASDGYTGEMAHTRMARLCTEEGVLFQTVSATSATMGPQDVDTLLSLLRECEAADMGALYEKRWGLAYKSRREFYNQPVSLALDFDQGHIADLPEPADDDQRTRNKWTVSRVNGSEATAEQTTGPMGTGASGPGVYQDSATLNVATDAQLPDQASFRVHLGTIDEDRWPAIGLNFTRSPSLIDAFTALPFGARITASHPPTQMPPDDLDLIIEGYSERWDTIIWGASLNCSPASAYRVAIVSDTATIQETPRVGSTTATLATGISTSDTSLSVSTGASGLWTTAAADFPLDINIEGERIRLSAISGSSSPQTFTVSARSVNGVVKSHSSGASVEVWQIATVGL